MKTKVLQALEAKDYKYRTASGIAKEIHIDIKTVASILEKNSKVRVSLTRANDGSKLYTLKNKVSAAGDIWTAFKAINKAKFGE